MRVVVVTAFAAALISALPAWADGETCTLKKELRVSMGGKWTNLPVGEAITVADHQPSWSTIQTQGGLASVSSSLLESGCGLAPLPRGTEKKLEPVPAKPEVAPAPAPVAPPTAPPEGAPVVAAVPAIVPAAPAAVAPVVPAAVVAVAAVPTPAPVEDDSASVEVPDVAPPVFAAPAPTHEILTGTKGAPRLVAVLDLKATGEGAEAAAGAFTTMLAAEIQAVDGLKAISRNEIKSILSHQADAQLAGCSELRCAADVAQLVNADVLITGQVDKVAGATVVSLSLIDAGSKDGEEGPAVLSRQEAAFRGTDDILLNLARPLVQRLFDGANATNHVGALEIFTEDGVTVIVDGKEVGTTPMEPVRDIPTGVHTVLVQKGARVSQTFDVILARNETTISRVELVEESIFDQPWFWAAAGGVVLVAGGTAAGITTYALLNQEVPTKVILGKPVE